MISNKTSLLIPTQLPEFVRDNPDYANFVLFLKSYYEWMEESGNLTDASKNLLEYKDIDTTTNDFLQYFVNDFLQYFPKDALINQATAVKAARQLYKAKGTLASYQFLFRILYNSDFDLFNTGDAVLKASAGKWYVPKSLKLATTDKNFLSATNLRIFGLTSKSIATIEAVVEAGTKIEVFISNIERLFQSGEFVTVVDNTNQPVYFLNGEVVPSTTLGAETLSAKIVGQVSQVNIDPNNRGLTYQVGDPVIVYGGLNSDVLSPIGANATVGSITSGSIKRLNVTNGGYGYSISPTNTPPQSEPTGSNFSFINIADSNINLANASVFSIDPTPQNTSHLSYIALDTISVAQLVQIGNTSYSFFSNNITANANTTLANAFSFAAFDTYPISSVIVNNPGAGISQVPAITAQSFVVDKLGNLDDLGTLGILAPIQIQNAGTGYRVNDKITITGGSGYGAYANVISVTSNGSISNVAYVYGPQLYPLGGTGYSLSSLPTLNVVSSNTQASNANLYVPGIVGQGATFSAVTDRVGSITTINLNDGGQDYVATPNVSLKVQDIIVSNVSIYNLPQIGEYVYQGTSVTNSTYLSSFASIQLLQPYADPTKTTYTLRVFNYNSDPNLSLPLKVSNTSISLTIVPNPNYASGVHDYGDGNAKATAKFLNGLVIGDGQYLDTAGQPSSYDVLQSSDYNNFTYQITVEKEIEKYRDILLNLLHPSGTKVIGRYAIKSNVEFNFGMSDVGITGNNFSDYTGTNNPSVVMQGNFTNASNNIVSFYNLPPGDPLTTLVPVGSTLRFTTNYGDVLGGYVVASSNVTNTVTLQSNTWLTYANVAYVSGNSGQNYININSITDAYAVVKGDTDSLNAYLTPNITLSDIVRVGDNVKTSDATVHSVTSIDFENNVVYLSTNLTTNVNNSLLTVSRTFTANAPQIQVFNTTSVQYLSQLGTEDGNILITEDGNTLLID